jgi:hypothetical protein
VNQQVANRNVATLNPANFVECYAAGSYGSPGTSTLANDRAIFISAAEWADAVAPAINDRLQRQVAAALGDWHQTELAATGKSWATTHSISYLPFASTWLTTGNPTTNNFCGNDGIFEGLAPIAQGCYDNHWTVSWSPSHSPGLDNYGFCDDQGTYLRCRFQRDGAGPLTAQIIATAADVARTYRSTISAADLTVSDGGTATLSMSLSGTDSNATATIDVTWSTSNVSLWEVVSVRIPHLREAAVLSDSRLTWFRTNNWHHYTYYAIAPGAAAPATAACSPGTSCLTVTGLPASTGNANDKRLVLVLSGRPLAGQSQPSSSRSNYFESDNATIDDESFLAANASTTFNDRIAACPFQHTPASGAPLVVCN